MYLGVELPASSIVTVPHHVLEHPIVRQVAALGTHRIDEHRSTQIHLQVLVLVPLNCELVFRTPRSWNEKCDRVMVVDDVKGGVKGRV